jgi:hypothetical protein
MYKAPFDAFLDYVHMYNNHMNKGTFLDFSVQ